MDNLLYWIWLSLACAPGSDSFGKLISAFGAPEAIYSASDDQIVRVIGSVSHDFDAVCNKDTKRAAEVLDFCIKKKVGILTYSDPDFPISLRGISDPPVLLYYRGVLPDFNKNCFIAMVGTRTLSGYGKTNTFKVAYDLARSGAVIVSGMAKGIDSVALAAALHAGKSTVAIIGSGIDVCYPSEHRTLARQIVKSGCVMTEFAPGTPPDRYNFPKRNRLISGLSAATLVMEGREGSGSVITARCAKKQGRAVYAFPGNVGNPNSGATNILIKNGAKLFTCADDIIRDFAYVVPACLDPFAITENPRYDINAVLDEYEVYSVTTAEDIERVAKRDEKKRALKRSVGRSPDAAQPAEIEVKKTKKPVEAKAETEIDRGEQVMSFDASALKVYKKIPLKGECSIDSLIDPEHSFADVMKALLNLEIARFIVMLPGDRVKRI